MRHLICPRSELHKRPQEPELEPRPRRVDKEDDRANETSGFMKHGLQVRKGVEGCVAVVPPRPAVADAAEGQPWMARYK